MQIFRMRRGKRGTYLVTDAQRPMSEDIKYRQRRYLIMMGIRVVGLLLAVFLFHGVARFIAAAVAIVMPYFAVVFANGGREPDSGRRFQPYDPERRGLPSAPGESGDSGGDDRTQPGDRAGQRDARGPEDGPPAGDDSLTGGDGSLSPGEDADDPAGHSRTPSNTA